MNEFVSAGILGFVQGLTELLPISSSGHLIIVRDILGISIPNSLLFDVLLHLATVLAIIIFFWRDIKRMIINPIEEKVMWLAIIIGTIPAVFFGLILEGKFRSTGVVVVSLILGSILFFVSERLAKQDREVAAKRGLWIGFFQALALIPGVSRSGSTISGGLLFGLRREEAARFSFLLGVPIIIGAGLFEVLKSYDLIVGGGIDASVIFGFVVAFVTALFAIKYLMVYLKNHRLNVFGWYRIILAIIVLILMY